MNNDSLFAAFLALIIGFGLGFMSGKHYENKQNQYKFQGPGWEFRTKPSEQSAVRPYLAPETHSHVRVWPFVDVERNNPPKN